MKQSHVVMLINTYSFPDSYIFVH